MLSQGKYIRDLLSKAKMQAAKVIGTPMIAGTKLSKFDGTPIFYVHLYRSVIGALQYATITKPEILFSITITCQFL